MTHPSTRPPKKTITPGAWQEARALIYAHRGRLAVGLGLLLLNRLAGLVLPSSSKWVIDRVINQHHPELLTTLALAAGGATLVQALTGFGLSQVLGVAAQRAITDMRRMVQAYVLRLPVSYFDSTKSGILIARIMSDAEGIRNLVGTGLVQLVGGLVTAALALGVLFYLNWRLTVIAILILACFGGGMAYAFTKLRPLFRERGKLNAEVTGRLGETLGGIRIVKAYRAERSERLVFTKGANTLFRNIATTMTGISGVGAFATIIIGAIGILMILEGGNAILSGQMTLGDFFMYGVFIGLVALPLINIASIGTQITEAFAGLDRIREIRRLVPRPGRLVGSGEEHLDQPRTHLQPAEVGAHSRGRSRSRDAAARRLSPPARRGAAGQLPVRRHHRAKHRVRPAARDPRGHRASGADRSLRRVRASLRQGLRHGGGGAGREALRRRAPAGLDRAGDPRSSSPIASRPFAARTRSS